jgi:hypothetical protein
MVNEKRLIDANAFTRGLCAREFDFFAKKQIKEWKKTSTADVGYSVVTIADVLDMTPTVDAVEVVHGQRLYNAHEVAEIIAELFGDSCACNFNSIDEWLPFKCELLDSCPYPAGVACWEQYLKFRDAKMDGDGNE